MKRAAAYARYSSDVQSDTSIEAQLEKIKEYCEKKGYTLVKEYIDRAKTAATDKRPAFQEMIKDAQEGKFDVVVVYKLDRFARNLYDSVVYTKKLEDAGVSLESVTEPITQDITGKFFRNIMSAINELYIENLKQEIKDKAIVVAQKGYHMGGTPPYGYKLVEVKDEYGKKRKKYAINEEEAKVVRLVFKLAAEGFSIRQIVAELNKRGFKPRRSDKWRIATVYEMLRNEKYLGVFVYNKGTKHNYHAKRQDTIRVPGAFPAIIDKELWNAAHERLKLGTRTRQQRHKYLLKGIVFCGECGSPMAGGTGGDYPTYMCRRAREDRTRKHAKIGKRKLEQYVMLRIKHEILDNVDFGALAEELNKLLASESEIKKRKLAELEKELQDVEKRIGNLVKAIEEGIALEEIRREIEALKERREQILYEMSQTIQTDVPERVTPERLKELWGTLKRQLEENPDVTIKHLIERVVVYRDGYIEIRYRHLPEIF